MSHPITAWFNRNISHPLTEMYARLDENQQGEADARQQPARPMPVDVSWMPMPTGHDRSGRNARR